MHDSQAVDEVNVEGVEPMYSVLDGEQRLRLRDDAPPGAVTNIFALRVDAVEFVSLPRRSDTGRGVAMHSDRRERRRVRPRPSAARRSAWEAAANIESSAGRSKGRERGAGSLLHC